MNNHHLVVSLYFDQVMKFSHDLLFTFLRWPVTEKLLAWKIGPRNKWLIFTVSGPTAHLINSSERTISRSLVQKARSLHNLHIFDFCLFLLTYSILIDYAQLFLYITDFSRFFLSPSYYAKIESIFANM